MDNNYLRMIANPYLLKKNSNKKIIYNNDDILHNYIKEKYPKIYLPPIVYDNISEEIDNIIRRYQTKSFVNDIITNVLNKFDKN